MIDLLRAARGYLGLGWCQRAEARDAAGCPAHPTSAAARCWSVTGATYAAVQFDGSPESRARLEAVVGVLGHVLGESPGQWNDRPGRTREDALFVLDQALGWVQRWTAAPTISSPAPAS